MALEQKSSTGWSLFWAVFVLALGLRVVLLGQHAFHMDEACIASWSKRILHGDLLLTGGMRNDKPPLQMYLGAVGLGLFGESESAIRLMNAAVSAAECGLLALVLAPVAGTLAALGAGMLLASSPLHRGYGASGIMDGPLAFFLLLSWVLAVRGRIGWSGVAWGLAVASKQTAILLPFPLLALPFASEGLRQAVKDWLQGALLVCIPLLLWSALFANPRLGALTGMVANQPEVGLRSAGLGLRLQQWLQINADTSPWPFYSYWAALLGPLLSILLWWRAKSASAKAWAWLPLFPLGALAVFAILNMRNFDRYTLPYIAALCAGPALVASLWPSGSRGRLLAGLFSLGLGIAALVAIRQQPLSLEQQGAAGHVYDGYRAMLLDVKAREPQGAVLMSSQGGLRHMGSWYLDKRWTLVELPEAVPSKPGSLYLAEREGTAPPAGRAWEALKRFEGLGPAPYWTLYRASGG